MTTTCLEGSVLTGQEIMDLVAAFVWHQFSHPPHDVTVFLAMQTAIHQVVEERDEALKSLSEILDACSFSPAELEETMTSLRIERDQARDECERMRKRRNARALKSRKVASDH